MAKTVITIEDKDDVDFTCHVEYEGKAGFDQTSNSHMFGALLVMHLGEIAEARKDEQIFGNAPSMNAIVSTGEAKAGE